MLLQIYFVLLLKLSSCFGINHTAYNIHRDVACEQNECYLKVMEETGPVSLSYVQSRCPNAHEAFPNQTRKDYSGWKIPFWILYDKPRHKTFFDSYEQGLLSTDYMKGWFKYRISFYCGSCSVGTLFSFSYLYNKWLYDKALEQPNTCYYWSGQTQEYCIWEKRCGVFRYTFGILSIPIVIFANLLNLLILRRMLREDQGAALYFHSAEIGTDFLLNSLSIIDGALLAAYSAEQFLTICYRERDFQLGSLGPVVRMMMSTLNQGFLTALVADRLYALSKPMAYSTTEHKKRAGVTSVIITVACIGSHLPLIVMSILSPRLGKNWKEILQTAVKIYSILPLVLVAVQTLCSILVQSKFANLMTNGVAGLSQTEQKNRKTQEKDKRLLLFGTVGVNVLTMVIKTAVQMSTSNFTSYFTISWYPLFLGNVDQVLTLFNGSGALLFHVLFCKGYRLAFANTRFGGLFCKPEDLASRSGTQASRSNRNRRTSQKASTRG